MDKTSSKIYFVKKKNPSPPPQNPYRLHFTLFVGSWENIQHKYRNSVMLAIFHSPSLQSQIPVIESLK